MTAAWVFMGLAAAAGFLRTVGNVGLFHTLVIIAAALISAAVGVVVVVMIDRFEPEPRRVTGFVFAFGATVAVVVSLVAYDPASGAMSAILGIQPGRFLGSVLVAPFTEELAKGMAVFGVYWLLRDEFNGVIDGVVYASMVGIGFAFSENVLYYTGALVESFGDFVALVFVRGVMSEFAHPLFTSMTGIGLAMMARRGRGGILWGLGGLAGAMALHAIWNGATVAKTMVPVYFLFFLPLLAVVMLFARFAMKNEASVVQRFVAKDVTLGLITPEEVEEIGSLKKRREVLRQAHAWGGPAARDARRAFYTAVLDLAFHRKHRFPSEPDPAVEYPLVCEIARYKRSLNPAWVAPTGIDLG